MSNLNKPKCATENGNTGICDCALAIETVQGFILASTSFRFSAADMADDATFLGALKDATMDIPRNRLYPVPISGTPSDNSQDPTADTLGNGGIAIVREGFYDITVQAQNSSLYLANQLRKFNKRSMGVFLYDQNGTLFGMTDGATLAPIPLELVFTDYKFPTGSNIAQVLTRLAFSKAAFLDGYGFYELGLSDYLGITGLQSIGLQFVSRAAGVINVKATILGCGDSLGNDYTAEASDAAVWSAVNATTGATIPITNVTYNATTSNFVITLDTTNAAYSASVAVIINLQSATALATNDIVGYESTGTITTT